MKHFSGRVAFVTGGASGIGYGLVQNFLGLRMKVIVVDFNQEYLQEKRQALAVGRRDHPAASRKPFQGSDDLFEQPSLFG